MASGSSAPLSFSFGNNTGTPASSAPSTGFSFGSNIGGSGLSLGPAAATTQGFSFSTPTTNTTANMFNVPPTKPPTLGTTGIAFGTPHQTATTTQFGAAGTTVFGSTSATTQNRGGVGGQSASQSSSLFNTQNMGGVGGQSASQSSGLFSGSMAPQTNASSFGGGGLPAANTSGSTSLFSGYMAPTKPLLNFPQQNAKPGGPTFGTSTPATQSSTTTTAQPAFGSIFSTQPGSGVQETSATTQSPFTFNSSTTAAASGGTPSQGSTVTFGGVAPQAKPTGMFSVMPSTAAASGGTPSQGSTVTFGGVAPHAKPTGMPSTSLAFGVKPVTAAPIMTTSAGIKLGTGTPQTAGTGFMLGTSQASTSQMRATALQSTGTTATSQAPGGGFKLGSALTTSTTQLSSTAGTTATTSGPTGFMVGTAQAKTQTATQPIPNLSLSQSTTGFNFSGQLGGQAKTTAAITSATTATKPVVGGNTNLVFAAKVKSTIPGSTPLQTTTTSTTKSTLGLAIPQTSTATSTTGPGFALGGKANGLSTTSTSSGLKLGTPATSTTATSGTTAATTSSEKYTYKQLEDQVNKWNIELEDLEKAFLEQAAQVNVTDRELMENGEKIAVLNNEVERAKAEQNRLDQELDFLISQQNELEDLLKPLEESVKQHGTEYAQEPDREREKIYTMAEKCDGQLKGMVQDLKEIIEYLNSSNANQQQEDNPVIQIAKILNVHMDSLQWIDQNSVLLQKRVDDIARLSEMRRKEHERSFRLGFD